MDEAIPLEFYLSQNYPNPFREKTTIKYCVAYKTRVVLAVYNSEGKEIEKLVDEEKKPGTYEVEFSAGQSRYIENLSISNYTYRLKAGNYAIERKMIKENNL